VLIFQDVSGSNLGPEAGYANKFRVFLNPSRNKVEVVPEIRSRPLPSTSVTIYNSAYEGPNLEYLPHILGTSCRV
jgi:hypothetical protein